MRNFHRRRLSSSSAATQGLAGAASALVQLVRLILWFIQKWLLGRTPRQAYKVRARHTRRWRRADVSLGFLCYASCEYYSHIVARSTNLYFIGRLWCGSSAVVSPRYYWLRLLGRFAHHQWLGYALVLLVLPGVEVL